MEQKQNQIKQITEAIEDGIKNFMQGDGYAKYLSCMAKFHNYSLNNTILIAMQRPDASLVAGFNSWKSNFDRHVKKGAQGIRIIQPSPFKKEELVERKDANGIPLKDKDGNSIYDKVEHVVEGYKVGYVFAYEDTEGTALPEICQELEGKVPDYDVMVDAIREISDCPITFEAISGGAKGYYSLADKSIHVQKDMPEVQTVKTLLHEVAHSIMHDKDTGTDKDAKRNEREVEAESVAYTVANYFNLDTSDYSFGYIASWAKDKELKELRESMDVIRKTAGTMIDKLEAQLMKQKLDQEQEVIYRYGMDYVRIYSLQDGFGCSWMGNDMLPKQSSVWDGDKESKLGDAVNHFIKELGLKEANLVICNQEFIKPKIQEARNKCLEGKVIANETKGQAVEGAVRRHR